MVRHDKRRNWCRLTNSLIFLLSMIFVYFLLAAQYESYILPLAVILSVPTGIFGVFAFIN